MQFRRILREPLLHFLLLGLALFAYYWRVAPDDDGKRRIVVTQADVDLLATQFQGTWNRPPGPVELNGLVDSYVRDEILYREGVALGLDRDDAVIKRRVRQKLDVLFEESVARSRDRRRPAGLPRCEPRNLPQPAVVSFDQIYFGSDAVRRSDSSRHVPPLRVVRIPRRSARRPCCLHARRLPLDLVARDFGEKFAEQLATAPVGEWSGPVASGFGTHLVRVSAIEPAQLPTLAPTCAKSSPANGKTSGASRRMQMLSRSCESIRRRSCALPLVSSP